MKIKLVLTAVILALCVLVSPVFAGGRGEKAAVGGSGITTIKWAVWDFETTTFVKPFITAYEAQHPNVKIEAVDLASASYSTLLTTQLSGGADIDVMLVKDIPGYVNLVKQNRLEPLNAYIAANKIDKTQYSGVVEQITVDSEVYALPFRRDFWVLFYNKDLFDAAGVPYPSNDLTFEQYDALARRLTRGSGANKTYGAHYHTWRSTVQLFGILDGKNTIVDGKYDFLTPIYEMIIKEQNDGIVQDYATLKTSSTHYNGVFYNNQIALLNMGSWFIASNIDKVKTGESKAKNWGIVKYPHPAGVPAGTTLGTVTTLGVNRNSKNKDIALDFIKFITSPEGAVILAKTGNFPALMNTETIGILGSVDGFPQDANSKEALNVVRAYLEMPLHDKTNDIELILNEAHDNIMTKNSTIQQGIQEMNDRVGKLLGK
jgi:multiple sugar transport system substrate-binding protein